MNMIPSNSLQEVAPGDIETLPYMGQWSATQLLANQVLLWNSEDIKCMFYIFRSPKCWQKYLVFSDLLDGAWFGLEKGIMYHLASRVPPMGWLSAVGICQHIHRRLLLRDKPRGAQLPAALELRKDRPLPGGSSREQMDFWQVYIDNFDSGTPLTVTDNEGEVPLSLSAKIAFLRAKLVEARAHLGEVTSWQQNVRMAFEQGGVPRSKDKTEVLNEEVRSLGGRIDGVAGRAHPGRNRTADHLSFSFFTLPASQVNQKWMQMLGGKHGQRFQFRHSTSACFSAFWKELVQKTKPSPLGCEASEDLFFCDLSNAFASHGIEDQGDRPGYMQRCF